MTADFAAVNPALEQRIRHQLKPQYNRSDVTANLIPKVLGRGKNLAWDIVVGTSTGQVFDDGQAIVSFNNDTELMAQLPWAEVGDTFKVTGRAEDAAAGDGTELAQLVLTKLGQSRSRAAEKLNSQIWAGTGAAGPQQLFGLTMTAGPLDSSGTYAGHSRATYPQWAGNVIANGGVPRAMSQGLFMYALEVAFTASAMSPTHGITTAAIWRHLGEMVNDERKVNQDIYIRGQKLSASMGFHSVEVNGIPIFRDKEVPAGTLVLFHEDYLTLEFLPAAPSRVERGKIKARIPLVGTPQEQELQVGSHPRGAGPIYANLIALPSNGNFDAWMIDATVSIKADRPNAHVWIKDIASSAA